MAAVQDQAINNQGEHTLSVRLLFVDDDQEYLELFNRKLKRSNIANFVINTAGSVNEAVDCCKQCDFDCLLVDYHLPDGLGTDIVERIREHAMHEHDQQQIIPPIIVVSAAGGEQAATRAIRAGAVDYIAKRDVTLPAIQRAVLNAVERSRLEAFVRNRNVALEVAYNELAQANGELERKRREIQKFYHTVSHEVKTPLAAVREFVSLVCDGVAGEVSADQQKLLIFATESCDQIRDQFSELLELARIDSGKLSLNRQDVAVESIVSRSLASIAESARLKNISIALTEEYGPITVYCDKERVVQVLSNLLVNAVKFTNTEGSVRLSVSASGISNGVTFKVADTGCGIHEENLETIFERLYQVEHAENDLSNSTTGLGLGLSISQEIIKLHNSQLAVSSELGVGSSFYFELPLAA